MRAFEFDFEARTERKVNPLEAIPGSKSGVYYWLDFDVAADSIGSQNAFGKLGLADLTVDSLLEPSRPVSYLTLRSGLILSVLAPQSTEAPLSMIPIVLCIGAGYCATFRRGTAGFLEETWKHCPEDFHKFAQSPGFLIYEFWDHLIASYRLAAEEIGKRVIAAESGAFSENEEIFERVALLSKELLSLRRTMVSAREVLAELATRRAEVIPISTQPFLVTLVATLDRLVADLAVEREILSEALNLYIGLVGHRTNQVVNRLTVVSFVFLPLTFLCGIYGMNFDAMPELRWGHGYVFFWAISIVVAGSTLLYMKFKRWW